MEQGMPLYRRYISLYSNGQAIIFLPCGFFFLQSSVFSSPNLSGHRVDVYHTSTRVVTVVALVRILDAGLKCAASAR